MMEDARECWASLHDRVLFKFLPATSSVASVCVPTVSGDRSKIIVQVPLPHSVHEVFSFDQVHMNQICKKFFFSHS